ncbi:hypothetical protein ILYODFUR_036087 [Ilyodon furcidens]|uniref:Uncharacterized protein n=1 Tax=Ilyodon furcidens TaxID=33524 RepID=A0ABV0SRY6_9TELE
MILIEHRVIQAGGPPCHHHDLQHGVQLVRNQKKTTGSTPPAECALLRYEYIFCRAYGPWHNSRTSTIRKNSSNSRCCWGNEMVLILDFRPKKQQNQLNPDHMDLDL